MHSTTSRLVTLSVRACVIGSQLQRAALAARRRPFTTILVSLCALFHPACGHRPPEPSPFKQDACAAPLQEWMEISQGVDSKALAELAGKLAVSAQADAQRLKAIGQASGKVDFETSLRKVFEEQQKTQKRTVVSQEFFEKATAYRQAVCNLERQIQSGVIKSPTVREHAEQELVDLSSFFGKTKEEEEKKLKIRGGGPVFTIAEGGSQAITATLKPSRPGRFELEEDLLVGDCLMRKGSAVEFKPEGRGVYAFFVRTLQTTNRDIWHQLWMTSDGQVFGEYHGPEMRMNQPFVEWKGEFRYTGAVPTVALTWRSRC